MAEDKSKQTVIIKRVKKGDHAVHGGAWKIAYADFVTAMMAFFLLLWLLNSVTQEQLEGISNYFAPVSISSTTSDAGDILGGATMTEEGVALSTTSRDSVTIDLPPPKAGTGGDTGDEESEATPSELAAERKRLQVEQDQFEEAKEELEKAIAELPELKELAESLLIDNTPEGLRIQLIDKEGLSMFPSGSAKMFPHTRRLLGLVSKVILKMPQRISISGHTDAQRFISNTGYSNWELSADRANAARRELVHFQVPFERVSRVVGKAATEPFVPDDPNDAKNRRLSIVMLRGTGKPKPSGDKKKKRKAKPGEQESSLPGLKEIKERQLKGLETKPKKATVEKAPVDLEKLAKPKPKKFKLIIPKLQSTEGESLPGLQEIRRRQLEKARKSSPVELKLEPKIDTK